MRISSIKELIHIQGHFALAILNNMLVAKPTTSLSITVCQRYITKNETLLPLLQSYNETKEMINATMEKILHKGYHLNATLKRVEDKLLKLPHGGTGDTSNQNTNPKKRSVDVGKVLETAAIGLQTIFQVIR